jgi:hypothetical protein
LAFSTTPFYLRRSWTCPVHFISFIFFRPFLTSSSHRDLGLPTGLAVNGFHLCIFFTVLVSRTLFVCPNQLNLWALTQFIFRCFINSSNSTFFGWPVHRNFEKIQQNLCLKMQSKWED